EEENIDYWAAIPFTEEDNKGGPLLEESSFEVLYPQYREDYLRSIMGELKGFLDGYGIQIELNIPEGRMRVNTTNKTWDPYAIINARDLMILLARSMPLETARTVFNDDVYCDVIKIKGAVNNGLR
ncbi:ribosomal RNA assembly KRR1, partial [Kipferlia bialata]